jgi:hypothetical protein
MRSILPTAVLLLAGVGSGCGPPYSPPCQPVSSTVLESEDFSAVAMAPGHAPSFTVDAAGNVEVSWVGGLAPPTGPGNPAGQARALLRRYTPTGERLQARDVPLAPAMFGADPPASIAWVGDTVWQLSAPFTFVPGSPPRLDSSLHLDVLDGAGAVVRSSDLGVPPCQGCVIVAGLRRVGDRIAVVYRRNPLDASVPPELRVLLFDAAGTLVSGQALELTPEPQLTFAALQALPDQDALLLASGDQVSVMGPDLAERARLGPIQASSAVASWDGARGLRAAWIHANRDVLVRHVPAGGAPGDERRVSRGNAVTALAAGAESLGLVFGDRLTRAFAWLGPDGRKRGGDLVLSTFEQQEGAFATTRGLLVPLGEDRFAYFGIRPSGLIREEVACAAR